MSDIQMSRSILDDNGPLVTEPANEEQDMKVKDEILQSASEDEDKDIQSPTPPNEPAKTYLQGNQNTSQAENPLV